jgi:hypothetical protein
MEERKFSFLQIAHTSFNGCLKLSDSIFNVSSLDIFFLTAGFSKTMFNELLPLLTFKGVDVVNAVVVVLLATIKEAVTAIGRNFIMF